MDAAVVGEAPLAAHVFAPGIAGARIVHADRGEEVKRGCLIAVLPAPTPERRIDGVVADKELP